MILGDRIDRSQLASLGSSEPEHLRVLVIDDDVEDAATTQRALSDIPWFTCTIDCVHTYTTALQAIGAKSYDVILLDHGLGARNGIELLHEAFGDTLPVAVVLLTGMASHEVDEAATRAGIGHLLEKSQLRAGLLERSVRYALERTRIEHELRRTRAVSQDNAARHLMIFNSNPSPLWVTDEGTTRFISVNDAALAQYGYTLDEFLTLTAYDIRVPEESNELAAMVATRSKGLNRVGSVKHRTKAGDVIDVDIVLHSIELDGRPCQLVMATDVTERKEKERERARLLESLQFERNKLSEIFAQAPAFMAVMRGEEHVFEMVNEEFVRLIGRNPLGQKSADAIPEAVDQGLYRLASNVLATGRPYVGTHVPVTFRQSSGENRTYSVSFVLQPMEEADGTISGVLIHGVDVTKEVASAEALRQSEAQYRTLVEVSPDGIVIEVDGIIAFANGSAARILGVASPAELVGRSVFDLGGLEAPERSRERFDRLSKGESLPAVDLRWTTKDGVVRDMSVLSVNFEFGGRPAVHTVFRDMTAHRHLEEQLRQAQKMEAVGLLAGGVAHDFNNLLTIIKGSVEFLLEDLTPDNPHRADVVEVRDAADRAAALTRQLLAFSRKQILQTRVLDVNAVVISVKPMLSRLVREDIVVETQLAPQLGSIAADPGQLEQVILNLSVNAQDAMPNGGRLLIETAEVTLAEGGEMEDRAVLFGGTYVVVTVSDTGIGMSPAVRARIFEPFFTTKPVGRGTGLGLATVYGIVKQSGGYLRVNSDLGHGTKFQIFFPVVEQSLAATPELPKALGTVGTETILLVEDMDAVREIALRVLLRSGYTVLEARNGREALEIATQYEASIDLLLSDVVMPEMDGMQLVDALKPLRPDMIVLFMSGYAEDEATRRGIEQTHTGFVPKPFSPSELLVHVRKALNAGRGEEGMRG